MKKIFLVPLLSNLFWLSANAAENEDATKALKEARVLFEKAVANQGGWQSTIKLLKNAELSLKKGKSADALSLARKAKQEAQLSLAQTQRERNNWSEPEYLK